MLLDEIREAYFFAISADEVADSANREQMSLLFRFVDSCKNIREEFPGFVQCDGGVDGETLTHTILNKIQDEWGLDMDNCRGQTYDGTGVMAGKRKGVSTRILNLHPKAIYTHCASHILNLCVVKSLNLQIVKNMMGLADSISRFFKNSPKRQLALAVVQSVLN